MPKPHLCDPALFDLDLSGTRYVVTGANRGIGLAIARTLAAKGHTVIGTARTPQHARELKQAVEPTGGRVEQLDTDDDQSIQKLAETLKNTPLHILINNAGVYPTKGGDLTTLNRAETVRCLETNAVGPVRVTAALLPNLKQAATPQHPAKVVQITSTMGSLKQADDNKATGSHAYRASKAALNMFNLLLAREIIQHHVVSVAVHPGWVRTDMGSNAAAISTEDSAHGLIERFDALSLETTGCFEMWNGDPMPF